jgi:hypothetical protein
MACASCFGGMARISITIVVAFLKVQKVAIFNPSLQKIEEREMVG